MFPAKAHAKSESQHGPIYSIGEKHWTSNAGCFLNNINARGPYIVIFFLFIDC